MKYIAPAAALALAATSATAGNLVFEAPVEEEVMEEEMAPMGSSAAGWIVPLLAIIAIGIAASDDDDAPASPAAPAVPATPS